MSLYDDASLVMIPTAVKDGKLYNIKPDPNPISGELVTNGNFDTDSDWTLGTGWSIANGKLTANNASGYALQSGVFESGASKTYKISFSVSDYVSGYFTILTSGGTSQSQQFNTNGNYTIYFNSNSPSGTTLHFTYFGSFSGSIDNVSVVEVDELPADFTFDRGSNLAATRVNKSGLIEKGRENLLLQSNQFDTTWSSNGITETSGQSGYDGTNDAWLIEKSNIATRVEQSVSGSGVTTFSVYLKKGTLNFALLNLSSFNQYFDLENGTLGNESGNASLKVDSGIESVGNGWYRCYITTNQSYTIARIYPARANGDNGGTSGSIYIQDAQLEQGLVATDYIESGATTGKAGILEDLPRLDYSGGASCPSLLLEPTRSNIITYSELFYEDVNNNRFNYRVTTVENSAISPSGNLNATSLIEDSTTDTHVMRNTVSITQNLTYTFSVFAKLKSGDRYLRLCLGTANFNATFNLINKTLVGTTNAEGNIEEFENDWVRLSVTGTLTSSNYDDFDLRFINSNTNSDYYAGDGTSGFYVWGAQIEQGSYATSYIPTYGTSQTRSTDRNLVLDLSDSGVDGESVTHFFHFTNNKLLVRESSNINVRLSSNVSNLGSVRIYRSATSARRLSVVFQDINGDFSIPGANTSTDEVKILVKRNWTTKLINVFINGVKITNPTSDLFNTWHRVEIEGTGSTINIKQYAVFPTVLTDQECIELTTI